ncbi:glycerol-3-phosphate dehydrogenase [Zhihengliuella salsuginis]|uniref:Glycerol-3-phosphate dehydrogenase n=1 Tax=Zhihengliuella salsuginis TaxID=578222 RepID=A0ABQ3GEG2_9MICC|nr:glycerol-3-phosphate dehydrogenase/oxidase [Zhihengliuella salsuginis]GHD02048.1 glycerol-3-phosphate dehydrogenase [Zhihengliuella salsuginis]
MQTEQSRQIVRQLQERPAARVLVVGGGINGVATFRDLALQGVDVTLVERGDYCEGASGASSHMIHGGIRYLENGEFRLVHESVQERNGLLEVAAHHVKPLRTTIPIFSTFSGILSAPTRFLTHRSGKPTERGAVLIKLGLVMYDAFAGIKRSTPWHTFVGRKASREQLPALRDDVKYTATYFDASVHNPERLTLDVLRDGLAANPQARAANYVSLIGNDGGAATLRDELTGETFEFAADVVVNATGAWTDLTNTDMGAATSYMGGTKGSHIVLDHPELHAACAGREIFFEHTDGRIVLIYPLGDRVLVGTTDLEADMSVDAVCTEAEVDYFFDLVGHVFPKISVERSHIVYRFSGVRPLPRHDDTAPGFVSRDYRIERRAGDNTVFSLVGGKWTTFRAVAEHLTNEVLDEVGLARSVQTTGLAIGGGRNYPTTDAGRRAWASARTRFASAERLDILLERYGTRADEVLPYLGGESDLPLAGLGNPNELSTGELAYMVEHEQVGHLVDVLVRRTALAFRGLVTRELVDQLADELASRLGWDEDRRSAEILGCTSVLHEKHQVELV